MIGTLFDLYVISDDINFYFVHSDRQDISGCFSNLQDIPKYTLDEINYIKENLPEHIKNLNLKFYKVNYTLGEQLL